MKLQQIIDVLQTIAPPELAESWDKTGLHTGDPALAVTRGLLCIDLTESVVAQAVSQKAKLIVAYHPPIFEPLKRLTPTDWKTRALLTCVKNDIAIYSPHTSLDAAPDGLNDWLASGLGKGVSQPIKTHVRYTLGKLVVYVPTAAAVKLRTVLTDAGGGKLGQYSRCTFNVTGTGTFQGNEDSHPAIGQPGRLEHVEEIRMEMIFPWEDRLRMVKLIREHHPYEEPGFDIYPLEPLVSKDEKAGQGRLVTLDQAVSLTTLTQRISKLLGVKRVDVTPAVGRARKIKTVGLCAGAGSSLLKDAGKIDAFFTGEMRYHDVLDASQRGVNILLAGHIETETPYLKVLRQRLAKATGNGVSWAVARV